MKTTEIKKTQQLFIEYTDMCNHIDMLNKVKPSTEEQFGQLQIFVSNKTLIIPLCNNSLVKTCQYLRAVLSENKQKLQKQIEAL